MEPRLPTSKKWTPYPIELTEQIREVVETFFADYDLQNGQFIIDGAIYSEEILLRIGIARTGQLRQDNFEASLQYGSDEKALDLIHLMADFLGEIWINYLEDAPDLGDLPLQWLEHSFEKKKIYMRYTSVNTSLEEQANRLLQEDAKFLVYGEDGDPDVLSEIAFTEPENEDSSSEELNLH